jgi:hypothetical protein
VESYVPKEEHVTATELVNDKDSGDGHNDVDDVSDFRKYESTIRNELARRKGRPRWDETH